MSSPSDRPLGIKSTRHLIELYFGTQMVTDILEVEWGNIFTNTQILRPDPRRIKYEIVMSNLDNAIFASIALGTTGAVDGTAPALYSLAPGQTIVVERTFFADLDAVTLPVWAFASAGQVFVSTREVFLSPASQEQLES